MHSIKFKKKLTSSLITSTGGFSNDRNSDTKFDNACDFIMVMCPKRVSFRFDHRFNIALTLFKIFTELKSHIPQTLVVKVTPSIFTSPSVQSHL